MQARFGSALAIVSRCDRKRYRIEVACPSKADSQKLIREFGGRAKKICDQWLERFTCAADAKPLKIGRRLVVSRRNGFTGSDAPNKTSVLVIPAGAAFGTGDHATTAMSLGLLEELTRDWQPGWSIVDVGTGSGILALAAKMLGARRVVALDHDPLAISTARSNARANNLRGIDLRLCDACSWRPTGRIDIISANLFSELLIRLLPKFNRAHWLILSGVLRSQEAELVRALERNRIDIIEARRRGKWMALLARNTRFAG